MFEWKPIETAPLHCRVLVAEASGYRSIARQEFDLKMKILWFDDAGRNPNPTHWQPLPDPPEQPSQEKAPW